MIVAATFYAGKIRDAIRAAKFEGNPADIEVIAQAMYPCLKKLHKTFAAYIPIPTTKERQISRGYNLPTRLCEFLATQYRAPIMTLALTRNDTPTQYGLSEDDRRENTNLFSPGPEISVILGTDPPITTPPVLIVDDVIATGTTFSQAMKIMADHKIPCTCLAAAMSPRAAHNFDEELNAVKLPNPSKKLAAK